MQAVAKSVMLGNAYAWLMLVDVACKRVPGGGPKLCEGAGAWAAKGDDNEPVGR